MEFSVLMSIYFKENPIYFDESLKSIFNQSLLPNEVVIVKDGILTNELDEVLNNYLDKYPSIINIYSLEKNSGLGVALNYGLKKCKYDYIARMDTDDICDYNRFKKQVDFLKKHPDVSVVGGQIEEFDSSIGDLSRIRNVPESDGDIRQGLKKRNCLNHVTVMFKKNDVLNSGEYQDCPFFEDYYLWCRMAVNNCKFYNIQEVLVNVRVGNDMIGRRGGLKYFKHSKTFYKKIYKLHFISFCTYQLNLLIRFFVAISPTRVRNFIYSKILRRGKKK